MNSLAKELLRNGRDPNDSIWVSARYRNDWAGASFDGALFDATRNVVELQPTSLMFGPENWLPLAAVTDVLGTSYRTDRENHRLLRKTPCDTDFTPVECIGGLGWETGRFNHPSGVTIDCRGWLLVADSDNHRVQVIRPEDAHVVAILGKADEWGRWIAGDCGGAMNEPVHAVCDARTFHIYVADRAGGLIHEFDDRFDHVTSFRPTTWTPLGSPALPPTRRPVGVTIAEDGALWVLDANYPRIMRMTTNGAPLHDVGAVAGINPFPGALTLHPRYQASGEVVLGPLDCGVYDQSWHKVGLDLELPDGAAVSVRTFASNEAAAVADEIPWAPKAPVRMQGGDAGSERGHVERLVLSDTEAWRQHAHGDYVRARPVLHEFTGDGPSSSNSFDINHVEARRLRTGDTIEFRIGETKESLTVDELGSIMIRAYATGVGKTWSAGSEVWLVERGGTSLIGSRRLAHKLSGSELIDLDGAPMNDRLTDLEMPHAVAALMRVGDRVELVGGSDVAVLEVESLDDSQTITVLTNVAVGGDYSTSALRLINAPGRLVCEDLDGFSCQRPRNASIEVMDEIGVHAAQVFFVEPDIGVVWLEPGSTVDTAAWTRFATPAAKSTDRGQYLWIQLRLEGALRRHGDETAIATPTIHRAAALTPRPSLLGMLPAVYSRSDPALDPVGGLFLERYLAMFEGHMTGQESIYEGVSTLLNIEMTDNEWLTYLSTWMGLVLDPSWDTRRRRQLLVEVMDLYQKRGTCECIERYLEIYTGNRPILLEGFQWRPASSMVLGRVGRLGCSAMKSMSCDYEPYAHRFTIYVFVDDSDELDVVETTVRSIIDSIKPAHAEYELFMTLPESRVGSQSRVGIDMVLRDRPVAPIRLPTNQTDESSAELPIIGTSTLARNPHGSVSGGGPVLDAGGIHASRITLN